MVAVEVASIDRVQSRRLQLLDRIDYRLATTASDLHDIYRLRYRAYLNEGAITRNSDEITTDRHDDAPNSWIFGIHMDGELASSIRISVASEEHPDSPSMDVFPDLLEPEIAAGKVLVDPTRFVADPLLARRFPELAYMTVRLAYQACSYFHADIGLATVRQEHQAFYKRMFLHQAVSGPRSYPGLLKPICLMAVDFPVMRDRVFARYPFLQSSYFERRKLFERHPESDAEAHSHHLSLRRATMVPRA